MADGRNISIPAAVSADILTDRLGRPDLGIVLGSGFGPLAGALQASTPVPTGDLPGWPVGTVAGHGGGVAGAQLGGKTVWAVLGRLHLYEGLAPGRVAFPVEVLAAAGAAGILLTTAAGGLLDADLPGDFAVIGDHLNLTGEYPLRETGPVFIDLQDAYDPDWVRSWVGVAERNSARLRRGVLAAVRGPCYETPAEVRMLRALGADLASMSVVPETIVSRYHGLRVGALACIANRGAGLGGPGAIDHRNVLETVEEAVRAASGWLTEGIAAMAGA
jgi:inosine/guanosine/xanthosine phosphorylase family protein